MSIAPISSPKGEPNKSTSPAKDLPKVPDSVTKRLEKTKKTSDHKIKGSLKTPEDTAKTQSLAKKIF